MFRTSSRPLRSLARSFSDVRPHVDDKRWPGWQVVVGIETHAQIKSRRKLFSEALTTNAPPNTHVSPFDAAFPGTLPHLNPKCVDLALRTALALKCTIPPSCSFDRKHYFYSDLPAGYQITQYYAPLALNGVLEIHPDVPVRIKQIQLEQDTAKSMFLPRLRSSSIDLNRAGTGLMEIITEPDLHSPEEAGAYVRALQALLRAVGSSDGNMEQGSLRCDVNVSINRPGEPLGTRCEIKNLNSVKYIQAAIISEITRHVSLLSSSQRVAQETRGFNEHTFETFRLRSKEDTVDYRYMPDPNLGTVRISKARIEEISKSLPPLPAQTRKRLQETYALSTRDTEVLLALDAVKDVPLDGEIGAEEEGEQGTGKNGAIAYFEALCRGGREGKVVANWMTHELIGQLTTRKESFSQNTFRVSQLGSLIDLVQTGKLTGTAGKQILRYMLAHPSSSSTLAIAQELNLLSAEAKDDLEGLCKKAMEGMGEVVEAYKKGQVLYGCYGG